MSWSLLDGAIHPNAARQAVIVLELVSRGGGSGALGLGSLSRTSLTSGSITIGIAATSLGARTAQFTVAGDRRFGSARV